MYRDRNIIIEEKIKEIKRKVKDLEEIYKCIIIPILILFRGEYISGFLKEPNRYSKSLAISKMAKSVYIAGLELMDSCLLREYSDEKLYSEESKYDGLILKAADIVMGSIVELSRNSSTLLKKAKEMINNSGDEQIAAIIKYYFKVDPDTLTDSEFYRTWSQAEWLMNKGIGEAKLK